MEIPLFASFKIILYTCHYLAYSFITENIIGTMESSTEKQYDLKLI